MFAELIQAEPEPAAPAPVAPEVRPKPARRQAKAAKQENQDVTDEQYRKAFCTIGLESVADY